MSYQFYKVLHFIGIFLLLLPLGGMAFQILSGGTREFTGRKLASILHGIGLLIIFVAGFGLMAKIGVMKSWPPWIFGKMAVWFLLGLMPVVIYRAKGQTLAVIFLILISASAAAYLATNKPGTAYTNEATPAVLTPAVPGTEPAIAPEGTPTSEATQAPGAAPMPETTPAQ